MSTKLPDWEINKVNNYSADGKMANKPNYISVDMWHEIDIVDVKSYRKSLVSIIAE